MDDIPVGYVIGTVVTAVFVWCGLRPRDTHGPRATPSYLLGTVSSELHGLMLLFVVAPAALAVAGGDLRGPVGTAVLVLPALTLVAIGAMFRLALRSVGVLDRALRETLGPGPRLRWSDGPGQLVRVLLAPVRWRRRDVVRIKNL